MICGVGLVVLILTLLYYFICKPSNGEPQDSHDGTNKAVTSKDQRHSLTHTTAYDLAHNRGLQFYTQSWICDYCSQNFRTIDRSPMYHCEVRNCEADLCDQCYQQLYVNCSASSAPAHTPHELPVAIGTPVPPGSGRGGMSISPISNTKYSNTQVYPEGSIPEGGASNSGRGAGATRSSSHKKERKRRGSRDSQPGVEPEHASAAHRSSYASVYGDDDEATDQVKDAAANATQFATSDGGTGAAARSNRDSIAAVHAASYDAVYG